MRWLALDVGSKRVGVAICDPSETATSRLPAMSFRGAAAVAEGVAKLCQERDVEALVVGVPRTAGGVGRGGSRVEAVMTALRAKLTLPLVGVDEAGSTREAESRLAAQAVPRRRWPVLVDSVAAEVILQRHLRAQTGAEPLQVDPVEDR